MIKVKLLRKGAKLPKRATKLSSGFDIYACFDQDTLYTFNKPNRNAYFIDVDGDVVLFPNNRVLIPTGIAIELPPADTMRYGHAEYPAVFEAEITPRSGKAKKLGLTVLNSPGTIDADYRGEIGVILHNSGDKEIYIKNGDAIAQMKIGIRAVSELVVVDGLSDTERGKGGFGHTGN